jgi:hypothetical protein
VPEIVRNVPVTDGATVSHGTPVLYTVSVDTVCIGASTETASVSELQTESELLSMTAVSVNCTPNAAVAETPMGSTEALTLENATVDMSSVPLASVARTEIAPATEPGVMVTNCDVKFFPFQRATPTIEKEGTFWGTTPDTTTRSLRESTRRYSGSRLSFPSVADSVSAPHVGMNNSEKVTDTAGHARTDSGDGIANPGISALVSVTRTGGDDKSTSVPTLVSTAM